MTPQARQRTAGAAALAALAGAFIVEAVQPKTTADWSTVWLISAGLIVVFCAAVGFAISGRPAGLIIDNRNRVSLSKLQAAAWSVLVLSALSTCVFARLKLGVPDAAAVDIPPDLLAVMGISATSLVATPVILSAKSQQTPAPDHEAQTASKLGDNVDALSSVGKVYARNNPADAQWLDIFRGEEVSNAASPDLSKVQQFLITVVVMIVYGDTIWAMLLPPVLPPHQKLPTDWLGSLPKLTGNMTWLIGISHAGYLAYKAAPHGASGDGGQSGDDAAAPSDGSVG
jgi:hypothetical protein